MITEREFNTILTHLTGVDDDVKEQLKVSVAPLFEFNTFLKAKLELSDEGLDVFNNARAKMYEGDIQSDLKELYTATDPIVLATRGDDLKKKEREIVLKYMKLPVEELCDEHGYEHKEDVMSSLEKILVYMLRGYEEAEKGMS